MYLEGVPSWGSRDADLTDSWQSSSASIEIAAYVLLCLFKQGSIVESIDLMKWLSRQRGPTGGFGSTQVKHTHTLTHTPTHPPHAHTYVTHTVTLCWHYVPLIFFRATYGLNLLLFNKLVVYSRVFELCMIVIDLFTCLSAFKHCVRAVFLLPLLGHCHCSSSSVALCCFQWLRGD